MSEEFRYRFARGVEAKHLKLSFNYTIDGPAVLNLLVEETRRCAETLLDSECTVEPEYFTRSLQSLVTSRNFNSLDDLHKYFTHIDGYNEVTQIQLTILFHPEGVPDTKERPDLDRKLDEWADMGPEWSTLSSTIALTPGQVLS